jgi:prefoldin subunit 5
MATVEELEQQLAAISAELAGLRALRDAVEQMRRGDEYDIDAMWKAFEAAKEVRR